MKDGGTGADHSRGKEQQTESWHDSDQDDARECKAHAERQCEGNRAAICKHSDEGLQKAGDDLIGQ